MPELVDLPGSKGLKVGLEGNDFFMSLDLSKDFGESSTGKTTLIASSSGNKRIGNTNLTLGLNAFCKAKPDLGKVVAPDNMRNLEASVKGNVITFRADLANEAGTTSKGDPLVATTSGNKGIGKSGIAVGINLMRKGELNRDGMAELMDKDCVRWKRGDVEVWMEDSVVHLKFPVNLDTKASDDGKFRLGGVQDLKIKGGINLSGYLMSKSAVTDLPAHDWTKSDTGLEWKIEDGAVFARFDASQTKGESSSGASEIVLNGKAVVPGTNISLRITAYKPIPGAVKRKVEASAVVPAEKRKKSSWTQKKVLKAVEVALEEIEGEIKLSQLLRGIAEKNGWEVTPELKEAVKKAVQEVDGESE
eukprot:Hpha_TRINITY_DN11746_c0_g4::TRINITY_DN11746_c0_g4_i1::g.31960::m.31960